MISSRLRFGYASILFQSGDCDVHGVWAQGMRPFAGIVDSAER